MKKTSKSIYYSQSDVPQLVIDGKMLKDKDIASLERQLDKDEQNGKARLKLVGYYTQKMRDQPSAGYQVVQHISWIIEQFPDSPFFEIYSWRKSDEFFTALKRVWDEVLKVNGGSARAFANAAKFCCLADGKASIGYLKRAIEIEPKDQEYFYQISHIYYLLSRGLVDKEELRYVKKSLVAGEQAIKLHRQCPKQSYLESHLEMVVSELSERAIDFGFAREAKFFGRYLLERNHDLIASAEKRNLTYNKQRYEVHTAYSILGRSALLLDDVDLAKHYLHMMPAFGQPDWRHDLSLAKELLAIGESKAVQDYLKACADNLSDRIWELSKITADGSKIPAWILLVWESHAPELSLTEFMQSALKEGVKEIDEWVAAIARGDRLKLPDFIEYEC